MGLESSSRMPIYEFYCSDCNTLFNFFTATVGTETHPACPRCERPELERRPARFATLRLAADSEGPDDDPFASMDDQQLDRLMGSIMADMEGMEASDDPRHLAGIFRKFGEASGMEPGPRMEEFLARLEAGEDPDQLESELDEGDDDESLEDLFRFKKRLAGAASKRPSVDETLHFL